VNKLVKFELHRNRIKLSIYSGCILLANLVLVIIDPDFEKAVISISILTLILPFIYMCMDSIKMITLDFYKDTKYLYLSAAGSKKEILGSRFLITASYAILYIIIVSVFQKNNALSSSTFIVSLGFSLTALLVNTILGLVVYKNMIKY